MVSTNVVTEVQQSDETATEGTWQLAHEELSRFAKSHAGLEWEGGRLLRAAFAAGAHARLGFASFAEYVERLFGYSPRLTREKLRVAEALEGLPELSRALRSGELTWSVVRELTRVTLPRTEGDWLEAARDRTAREVEELVAGRRLGDRPSDAPDPSIRRHFLKFEVSGETRALVAEALVTLRRETGQALDDDSALLLMARAVLGGPTDAGRASYQVEMTVCERCRRGEQTGNGSRSEVAPEMIEMCECDAQHLDLTDAAEAAKADAAEAAPTQRSRRATQTIPPALRRRVWRRDGGRCVVSGCRNGTWVDVHHLVPRALGGEHEPENLVCLCGAHHRAVHRGTLVIEGSPAAGLTFLHSDGRRYGNVRATRPSEARLQVLGALKNLGFREHEVRLALDRCANAIEGGASAGELLQDALALLTERVVHTA